MILSKNREECFCIPLSSKIVGTLLLWWWINSCKCQYAFFKEGNEGGFFVVDTANVTTFAIESLPIEFREASTPEQLPVGMSLKIVKNLDADDAPRSFVLNISASVTDFLYCLICVNRPQKVLLTLESLYFCSAINPGIISICCSIVFSLFCFSVSVFPNPKNRLFDIANFLRSAIPTRLLSN